jgi:hypothetical protein
MNAIRMGLFHRNVVDERCVDMELELGTGFDK